MHSLLVPPKSLMHSLLVRKVLNAGSIDNPISLMHSLLVTPIFLPFSPTSFPFILPSNQRLCLSKCLQSNVFPFHFTFKLTSFPFILPQINVFALHFAFK